MCDSMAPLSPLTSKNGGLPVAISTTVHPRDQISAWEGKGEGGREGGRGRERGKEGGRKGGRERGRERGREKGREGWREREEEERDDVHINCSRGMHLREARILSDPTG